MPHGDLPPSDFLNALLGAQDAFGPPVVLEDGLEVRDAPVARQKVLFQLLGPSSKAPTKAYRNDAGWDFYASEPVSVRGKSWARVPLGVASAIPPGYCWQLWGRSGLAKDYGVTILAGLIDPGYRGEMAAIVYNPDEEFLGFEVGEKVVQGAIVPCPEFDAEVVQELPESDRGQKGFGSSGS